MTTTSIMAKIINLCSIKCDTSLERKDLNCDIVDDGDKNHKSLKYQV